MPLFNTYIVVDWSARSEPSPKKESENAIWWAVARITDGPGVKVDEPEYATTRSDALDRLTSLLAKELDDDRRVLLGFDFAFGYPEGFAKKITGKACAMALWVWLATQIKDNPDNTNNRYNVAAKINEKYPGCGPFWGRDRRLDCPTVPTGKPKPTDRSTHPPERRICDERAAGAKTVWQLAYKGAVGSQMLLGLPALKRLIQDSRIKGRAEVWPFQTGLRKPCAKVVIAEVYPSLLSPEIRTYQSTSGDNISDRAQVRVTVEAFARMDMQGRLDSVFTGPPDLTKDQRHCIESEEGWILGLGYEDDLRRSLMSSKEAAQDEEILLACPPFEPSIKLLWTAIIEVGSRRDLGACRMGQRFIFPITGGRVIDEPASRGLGGRILPGGADRQLLRPDGVRELDALYEMQTDAGQIITVRNRGIVDSTRQSDPYVMSTITAKIAEGSLDWLNRRILIGTLQSPGPEHPKVIVRAWIADNC